MKRRLISSVMIGMLPLAAMAHHGHNSQFDPSKELAVSGIVTEIKFVNPHSYVHFDVTNAEGEVENWRCEMRAANVLKRSGWSAEMFKPGTPIDVTGIASRKEATGCYAETLALGEKEAISRYDQLVENKVEVEAERPKTTPWGDPYIGGDWAAEQRLVGAISGPSFAGGPPMGPPPTGDSSSTMTAAGKAAMAEMQAEADVNTGRLDCKPRDFFSDWIFDQHSNRIIQEEDKITLKYGFMDTERVIHLDMQEHPKDIVPSFGGHSIGSWDGDVLVVETTGFPQKLKSRGPRIVGAVSDQYHTVERFSVDTENGTLTRSYVAEDPLFWVDGYKEEGEQTISLADYPWEPYECEDLSVE